MKVDSIVVDLTDSQQFFSILIEESARCPSSPATCEIKCRTVCKSWMSIHSDMSNPRFGRLNSHPVDGKPSESSQTALASGWFLLICVLTRCRTDAPITFKHTTTTICCHVVLSHPLRHIGWKRNVHKTQNTFCVRVQKIVQTKSENGMYTNLTQINLP